MNSAEMPPGPDSATWTPDQKYRAIARMTKLAVACRKAGLRLRNPELDDNQIHQLMIDEILRECPTLDCARED